MPILNGIKTIANKISIVFVFDKNSFSCEIVRLFFFVSLAYGWFTRFLCNKELWIHSSIYFTISRNLVVGENLKWFTSEQCNDFAVSIHFFFNYPNLPSMFIIIIIGLRPLLTCSEANKLNCARREWCCNFLPRN